MINVIRLVVGQLATNCYILEDTQTHEGLIFDPGDDDEYIVDTLLKNSINPRMLLLTHGHFDHCLAALALEARFQIPTLMHDRDIVLLKRMRETAEYFLNHSITDLPPQSVKPYEGVKIAFGNHTIQVIETPGHTPGSVCLYLSKESIIFSGDLLFEGGLVGRTDFSYSNKDKLKSSINTILGLPDSVAIYPGHGEKTTVEKEKKYHIGL